MRLLSMKKKTEKRVSHKAPNAVARDHILSVRFIGLLYCCALWLRAAHQDDIGFGMAAHQR